MFCTLSWAMSCIRAWEGSGTGVFGSCKPKCREQEHNLNPSFRCKFGQWLNTILVTAGVLNIYNLYQEPSGHKNLERPVQTRETSRKEGHQDVSAAGGQSTVLAPEFQ